MFWQYQEWNNAFLIQLVAIIVAVVYGKMNNVKNSDLFIAISLVSPVAILLVSSGVAGAVFLSDFAAIFLLFRGNRKIKKSTAVLLAFLLFLVWPILSTPISNIYGIITNGKLNFENSKIFIIQLIRYFLYFILFAKLASTRYNNPTYIVKLIKIQSVMIIFIFTAILLGYFNIIKVDPWNVLIKYENEGTIGKGGMFLYRGGVGALSVISIPIIFFCSVQSKGFYKYFLTTFLLVILITVLFSGSRQGILLSIISLFLTFIIFKQKKIALIFLVIGTAIIALLLQVDVIKETLDWIIARYGSLFDKDFNLGGEINQRNFLANEGFISHNNGLFYDFFGSGLGGQIYLTESDYYNTYLYFGIIGMMFYFSFVIYMLLSIFKQWTKTNDLISKQILSIMMVLIIIAPFLGIQQWFIMTYGSANSMIVYLFLYYITLGNNKINFTSKLYEIKK